MPREAQGRTITYEQLTNLFHLPEKSAAGELGICLTSLKKHCRQQGILRWPFRRLKLLVKIRQDESIVKDRKTAELLCKWDRLKAERSRCPPAWAREAEKLFQVERQSGSSEGSGKSGGSMSICDKTSSTMGSGREELQSGGAHRSQTVVSTTTSATSSTVTANHEGKADMSKSIVPAPPFSSTQELLCRIIILHGRLSIHHLDTLGKEPPELSALHLPREVAAATSETDRHKRRERLEAVYRQLWNEVVAAGLVSPQMLAKKEKTVDSASSTSRTSRDAIDGLASLAAVASNGKAMLTMPGANATQQSRPQSHGHSHGEHLAHPSETQAGVPAGWLPVMMSDVRQGYMPVTWFGQVGNLMAAAPQHWQQTAPHHGQFPPTSSQQQQSVHTGHSAGPPWAGAQFSTERMPGQPRHELTGLLHHRMMPPPPSQAHAHPHASRLLADMEQSAALAHWQASAHNPYQGFPTNAPGYPLQQPTSFLCQANSTQAPQVSMAMDIGRVASNKHSRRQGGVTKNKRSNQPASARTKRK